jgi:hypothetical protein
VAGVALGGGDLRETALAAFFCEIERTERISGCVWSLGRERESNRRWRGVPDTVGIRAESAADLQVFVEEFVGLERTSAREKKRVSGGDRGLFIGGFKRAGGARV